MPPRSGKRPTKRGKTVAKSRKKPSIESQRSHIGLLPPELLLIIFKIVYFNSREPSQVCPYKVTSTLAEDSESDSSCHADLCPCEETHWPEDEGINSSTLFPNSIASVCLTWRAVMDMVPYFWTRLVIFVDSNPTPLSRVSSLLELTGKLPLQVTVTRRTDDFPLQAGDPLEPERAQAVMKLLEPHTFRCTSFVFDVIHSSSLPFLSRSFHGAAPWLRVLKLECNVDDQEYEDFKPVARDNYVSPTFPCLTTLALDGATFMDAYYIPKWEEELRKRKLDLLSFSCFTWLDSENMPFDDERFGVWSVISLVATIPHKIGKLVLQHIEDDVDEPEWEQYVVNVRSLEIIGAPTGFLDKIVSCWHTVINEVRVAQCELVEDMIWSEHLILDYVTYGPNTGYYDLFSSAFSNWNGTHISFHNCPQFDDEVLSHFGRHFGRLHTMNIHDCNNFSIPQLKEMICAREDEKVSGIDESDSENTIGLYDYGKGNYSPSYLCGIRSLRVTGYGQKLSQKDRRWFRSHVRSFSWK